jgi:hypothetical protein
MSDHTTSGTLSQGLVPFALALKLMLHELSMSLTAEAHVDIYSQGNGACGAL